jgi:putative spermidine/putrescine transport system substrate-binding protein
MDRTDAAIQEAYAGLPSHPSVVSSAELGQAALPELQAGWISAIEQGWLANVGN